MDRDKQIIVGLGVLVLLGGAVYVVKQKDDKVGKTSMVAADLPSVKGPEDPDKLEITTEKGKVVLVKTGETWALEEPVKFPAHNANVKSLIDNLKELKATELIEANAPADHLKTYDLDGTKVVHVIASKAGETKLDITFGKSGGRGQMAMLAGKTDVYAVGGFSNFVYTRDTKGWRDTEIFKFDDQNATAMTIQNDNGLFSFTKGDKWAGTFKAGAGAAMPIAKFEDTKVGEALRAFKSLSADEFGDGKSDAETGLDKPAVVTISLKDNAGTYKLMVGKISTGSSHYAKKDGSDVIYTISSWPSEWATADLKKFQKADKDAGAPAAPPGMGMGGMPPGMGMGGMPPGMQMPPGMGDPEEE